MAVTGLGEIAEELRRATVLIHSENRGDGSGIIWSSDGSIVTNAHVVRGSRVSIQLWDNREFEATILSRDSRRDLAALCIAASGLPAVTAADSSQIRPGELVIAIGNPLGFVGALSTGVVHAVGPLRGIGSQQWVQAGVRLAPGNSGGPLADARGRVIGVNTMVAGGLALAIPSNAVRDFLVSGAPDAWLGVTVHPVRVPRGAGRGSAFGLVLLKVEQDSPAASASLLPGDILLGTDEKSFVSVDDLAKALQGRGPRLVRFEFLRGDYQSIRQVTVRFGEQLASGSGIAA
jgi:serine protease Do